MNTAVPMITVRELIDRGEADVQTGPFGTQLKASEYVDSGTPVINVRNVGFGDIRDADLEFITEAKAEQLKAHKLRKGDIVFGRKGAVERHALIADGQDGWVQGSDCLRLRLASDTVCERYASYYLRTRAHQDWMQALCSFGATMASLNQDIVKRITIPLPDLPIQRKIAAILTAYDDLVEANKRRIVLHEEMAEELYSEWFVRMRFPGHQSTKFVKGVPEGWEVRPISSFCDEIREGVKKRDLADDEIYIGLEHIPRKSIAFRDSETADSVASDKLRFKERDILFSKIRPYLHKVALAHFSGACSSDTIVLRPRKKDYEGFLLFTVFSETFIELATTAAKGTKMPRADWAFLEKLELKIPPAELLEAYQARFDESFSLIAILLKSIEQATESRDLLLPRLISGKLAVEDLDIEFPPSMREEANAPEPAYA